MLAEERSADTFPARWPEAAVVWIVLLVLGGVAAQFIAHAFMVFDDQRQHLAPYVHLLPGSAGVGDPVSAFYLAEHGAVFRALYAWPACAGVHPLLVGAVVALVCWGVTAWAAGRTVLAMGVGRAASWYAAILCLIYFALRDDIAVAASRSIGWPALMLCLWALAARSRIGFTAAGLLAAVIYPGVALLAVAGGGLLLCWEAAATRTLAPLWSWATALLVPVVAGVAMWSGHDPWGPTIGAQAARALPEFGPAGRTKLFVHSPLSFWISGTRTGMLPLVPLMALVLPGLLGVFAFRRRLAMIRLPLCVAAGGIVLWLAAQALLFRLYLPSRFTDYGLSAALLLLAALALGRLAERGRAGLVMVAALLVLAPTAAAALGAFPHLKPRAPRAPGLIRVLRAAPDRMTVAGLSDDLDLVQLFARRPIYWSRETAQPYKLRYRAIVVRRLALTTRALFAPDPAPLLRWAAAERIGWIMVDADLFTTGSVAKPPFEGTPGATSAAIPPRARWPGAWLVRQRGCARVEAGVMLFAVPCLRAATRLFPGQGASYSS